MSFRSRVDAGSKLAMRLKGYTGSKEEIGLGNPRGGLPGAFQVSAEQGLLFDQFAVRKLGVPWQVLDLFPENLCEGKSKVPPISQA